MIFSFPKSYSVKCEQVLIVIIGVHHIFFLINHTDPKKGKTMKELITLLEQLKEKMEGTDHFHIQTNSVEHDNIKSK